MKRTYDKIKVYFADFEKKEIEAITPDDYVAVHIGTYTGQFYYDCCNNIEEDMLAHLNWTVDKEVPIIVKASRIDFVNIDEYLE